MSDKPRLLIIETVSTIGGGERAVLNLFPDLLGEYSVTFAIPAPGELSQELARRGLSYLLLPSGDSYTRLRKSMKDTAHIVLNLPTRVQALVRLIRSLQPSLVLLNCAPSFHWGTLACWATKRPVVWYSHNTLQDQKARSALKLLARLSCVKTVISPSLQAATQFGSVEKSKIVRSGVDADAFRPSTHRRLEVRSQIGTPKEQFVFAVVGEVAPYKGQLAILAAAKEIAPSQDFELWVVGNSRSRNESYCEELRRQAGEHSFVRLLGYRSDVTSILAAVDCLVIASQAETGPLVLLEALASGVPVISTPVGIASELLNDGACGYLYPAGDRVALASAMRKISGNPDSNQMGAVGRVRVSKDYSLESHKSEVMKALDAAMHMNS